MAAKVVNVILHNMVERFVVVGHLVRHHDELGDRNAMLQPFLTIPANRGSWVSKVKLHFKFY